MEERPGGGGALEGVGRTEPRLLQFDGFRVDPAARALWRDGEPVPLTPKALSVLLLLLERPGQVVTKDELLRRAWDRDTASDASLTQCISSLRKALGESASERHYVITVPAQGYCFGASVETLEPAVRRDAGPSPPPRIPRWRRSLLEAFAMLLLTAAALAWIFLSWTPREPARDPQPALPAITVPGLRNLSGREEARLAAALPWMLKAELADAGGLRVVPGEEGADLILAGSFLALGDREPRQIRLDLRVIQADGGETLVALAEVGSEQRLDELVERAAARLLRELDAGGGISGRVVPLPAR